MKKKKHRLLPYRQALPSIVLFQLIAGLFLSLWMTGYSILSSLLIRLTGRVAVSQPDSAGAFIPLMVGSLTVLFVLLLILVIFSMPFFMLKVTALYLSFQSEGEWEYRKRKNRKSPLVIVSAVLTVLLIAFTTVLVSYFYDDVFPGKVTATYIAHRAGGNEGPENTVAGLEAAYALGASGREIDTGYLAFASFGDTASLNCDYLALEEEVATQDNIDSIHFKGKKILVWTVNDAEDIEKFLQSGADALITDNVKGTKDITAELESAPAPDRIFNGLFRLFYGSAQR